MMWARPQTGGARVRFGGYAQHGYTVEIDNVLPNQRLRRGVGAGRGSVGKLLGSAATVWRSGGAPITTNLKMSGGVYV